MTRYVVLEMQTNEENQTGTLIDVFDDRNLAESKYHLVLSAAAVSSIAMHTAVLLTNKGELIEKRMYLHAPEPEPE